MEAYKKVQKTLTDWVRALAQEEFEDYKTFYSPNFLAGRQDLTTKRWLDTWRAQTGGKHLHTTNTSIQFYDDKLARVTLVLHNYLPDGVVHETHKDLLMEEEDGDWKIRVEVDTKTQTLYERPSLPAVAPGRVRDQKTASARNHQPKPAGRGFLYYSSVAALAVVLLAAFTASYFYSFREDEQPVADAQESPVSTPPLAKTVPSPVTARQSPPPEPVDRHAVAQMLNGWVESVANKDIDRYLGFYSDNFFKDQPDMRKKWEQAIEKVIMRPGPVRASIKQFELIPHQDNSAVDVVLKQDYDVAEAGYLLEKKLTLESEADGWRIRAERTRVVDQRPKQTPTERPHSTARTDDAQHPGESSAPAQQDTASVAAPELNTATNASSSQHAAATEQAAQPEAVTPPAGVAAIAAAPEQLEPLVTQSGAQTSSPNDVVAAEPIASDQAALASEEPATEEPVSAQLAADEPDAPEPTEQAPTSGSQEAAPAEQSEAITSSTAAVTEIAAAPEQPEPLFAQPESVAPQSAGIDVAALEPLASDQAVDQPGLTADAEAALTQTMENWARAWSKQDVTAYLSFYSSEFVPAGGGSKKAWTRTRRWRIANPEWIKVQISDIDVAQLDTDRVQLTLTQTYRSNRLTDTSRKTFILRRDRDNWVILAESVIGSR